MREYLKLLRAESGKTQMDVAKELDVSESYYSLIESGERQSDMGLSVMSKLAKALSVPLDVIITEETKLKEGA